MKSVSFSVFLSLVILLIVGSRDARAFPEMVRHGYTHCTACHTNLAGGGTLNEYGRGLSRELLSQKTLGGHASIEGDEKFLWGTVDLPEWLQVSGDIRTMQMMSESKAASRARFMIMQVDLDADITISPWMRSFLSIGRIEPRVDQPELKDFISIPRLGFDFLLTPPEQPERLTLRVGRFLPAFGIAFAEHTLASRRLLDLGPGQERYAAELGWIAEPYSVIVTAITLQAQGNQNKAERGGILHASHAIGEKARVNFSYYESVREASPGRDYTRRVYGVSAITELSKDWYAMIEIDRPQDAKANWGLIEVLKVGHEFFRGLHFIGIQEYANSNMNETNPRYESYGLGVEWFPRTHWDFFGIFRRERNTAIRDEFDNVVWLIGHFYF